TVVGSGSTTAISVFNSGIFSSGGSLLSSSGNLSITGHGGTGSVYNAGVHFEGGVYQSSSGSLSLLGDAHANTTSVFNHGVWIMNASVGGGAGSSVTGTGGGGIGFNHGVSMVNVTGSVTPGDVTGSVTDGSSLSKETDGNFFP
ncbi:MAG: hypothetical protein KDN19_22875, partial [Verrucomicrobiae bacterium]|nr:hypothetical protein [Verrucomicrobiae bacterium]